MGSSKESPLGSRGRTSATVVHPRELAASQRDRMYRLMDGHYMNVRPEQFFADLDEKNWVVVMADGEGIIQGFSAIALFEHVDDGRTTLGFYSGDTVLAPDYWGDTRWLGAWAKHVFSVAESRPECESYWILLAASHRIYRFLPGFFREYYPAPDRPMPEPWKERLDQFVRRKFLREYDPERGVVELAEPTPIRHRDAYEAQIPLDDPHVRYFLEKNPGHLESNFLACISRLDRSNMTPAGLRFVAGS